MVSLWHWTSTISFFVHENVSTWCEGNCRLESPRKEGGGALVSWGFRVCRVAANADVVRSEILLTFNYFSKVEKVYCYDKSGAALVYQKPPRIAKVACCRGWNVLLVQPDDSVVRAAVYQVSYRWRHKSLPILKSITGRDWTCCRAAVRGCLTAPRV